MTVWPDSAFGAAISVPIWLLNEATPVWQCALTTAVLAMVPWTLYAIDVVIAARSAREGE